MAVLSPSRRGKSQCIGCGRYYESCECQRPYPGARVGSIPARLYDLLQDDWWTGEGAATALDLKPASVYRNLWRLHARGLIQNREYQGRTEWKTGAPAGRRARRNSHTRSKPEPMMTGLTRKPLDVTHVGSVYTVCRGCGARGMVNRKLASREGLWACRNCR